VVTVVLAAGIVLTVVNGTGSGRAPPADLQGFLANPTIALVSPDYSWVVSGARTVLEVNAVES
jgi:hypothetical protein